MTKTLLSILSALVALTASAQDKKPDPLDAKKLSGTWEAEERNGVRAAVTLMEGGEALFTFTDRGGANLAAGTYRLDGAKLHLKMVIDDVQREYWERTVARLTDTELVLRDANGTERTLTRAKNKDKK